MAVAFINTNAPVTAASGSSATGNQAITSGTNEVAIAWCTWDDGATGEDISTFTINSVAATALGAKIAMGAGGTTFLRGFRLVAPTTGATVSCTMTMSGADCIHMGFHVDTYSGVDQTTPIRASTYTTFSGSTAADGTKALAVTSATDDMAITGQVSNAVDPTLSGSPSAATMRREDLIDGSSFLASGDSAGTTTETFTWNTNFASANAIAIAQASLQAAGAAATVDGPLIAGLHFSRIRRF